MSKKQKWLLSLLVVGLLLCGIGGGVMFGEFSGLTYGGDYVYRTNAPKTQTFQVSLEELPEGPVNVVCYMSSVASLLDHVVVDETLEEGIVKIETTYDPEFITPSFFAEPIVRDEAAYDSEFTDPFFSVETVMTEKAPEEAGYLELRYYGSYNDLAMVFALKDMVLNDLKNNTIRSYEIQDVFGLTISAAPETAARLRL